MRAMTISAPPPAFPVEKKHPARPTRVDQWVLGLHIAVAAAYGVFGILGANDPGWSGLQRLLVAMIVTVWGVGILSAWLLARRFESQTVRLLVLAGAPFAIIFVVFASVIYF